MSSRRRRDPRRHSWDQARARRRRARRLHRRDTPRAGDYEPIRVDAGAAERGVRWRLAGALVFGALTLACLLGALLLDPPRFTLIALVTFGTSGAGAAVSLVMSARREELVHQLATDLQRDLPRLPPAQDPEPGPELLAALPASTAPTEHSSTDGSV